MSRLASRLLLGAAVSLLLLASARAQNPPVDYRQFFKKPETAMEFWSAMKFELELGKYELATTLFQGFLEKMPTDQELIALEEKEGMSAFLRLLNIPDSVRLTEEALTGLLAEKVLKVTVDKLRPLVGKQFVTKSELMYEVRLLLSPDEFAKLGENIEKRLTILSMRTESAPLIERVSEVVRKFRSDPERIGKFVRNLSATPEERAYAIVELKRSGPIVIPYMIRAMRDSSDGANHPFVLSAMLSMSKDVMPPLLSALDVDDAVLRAELIDVLLKRNDPQAVPFLWYYAASPRQPDFVRQRAAEAIASLEDLDVHHLPPAKEALTREANRWYTHRVKFQTPSEISIWKLAPDNKSFEIPASKYTATQAEEYFGLKFAKLALDLDPSYRPAQVTLLSLALDKAYERAGVDKPLEAGSPVIKEFLRSVNPELVTAVLERALSERRIPVILGAVRTLGDLTETKAARPGASQPPALVKASNFPDRRIQMAAVDAMLRFPGPAAPPTGTRIVEILRRNVAADVLPRAIVADTNKERGDLVAQALKQAGFDAVVVLNSRDLMHRLAEAADIDVILLDQAVPGLEMTYLLTQLRADVDNGNLPIFITVAPGADGKPVAVDEDALRRLASRYRNVYVMPATTDSGRLKTEITAKITESMGQPLTAEERKEHAAVSMLWLMRMALGEMPGYDVRPARNAIQRALRSDELRPMAIAATSGLPGRVPQRELVALVLDPNVRPEFRSAAAIALTRHMQQHGLLLTKDQIQAVNDLFRAEQDPKLKANIALVVGGMRPSSAKTGLRLQEYAPPTPMPPEEKQKPKEMEKPKEAEKEKDMEKEKN